MSGERLYPYGLCDSEPACFLLKRRFGDMVTDLNTLTNEAITALPDPTTALAEPSPETLGPAQELADMAEQRLDMSRRLASLIQCGTCPLIEICQQLQGE